MTKLNPDQTDPSTVAPQAADNAGATPSTKTRGARRRQSSKPAAAPSAKSAKSKQPRGKATNTAPEAPGTSTPKGKIGRLIESLRRQEGATIEAMMTATGWQAHSVRGAMSGALKKKLGLAIDSEKTDGGRVYRITDGAPA